MFISVLGTGTVGQTIAAKLNALGHTIDMVTRDPMLTSRRDYKNNMTGESFTEWHARNPGVNLVAFERTNSGSDLLVNALGGMITLKALENIPPESLTDKIMLDISNPLDFTDGFPPKLSVCNTHSLAEQIQEAHPKLQVVKSLNTMTASLMVNPGLIEGNHQVFISGNFQEANEVVHDLLKEIGWREEQILNLGDLSSARGTEMWLPLWSRVMQKVGNPMFNLSIQKVDPSKMD